MAIVAITGIAEVTRGATPTPYPVDVALDDDGVLHGQVARRQGSDFAGTLQVIQSGRVIQTTRVRSDGYFAVALPSGGVYVLQDAERMVVVRAWQPGTAPPSAVASIDWSRDEPGPVMRGQGPAGKLSFLRSDQVLAVSVVATAIAIPAVIQGNEVDGRPGS